MGCPETIDYTKVLTPLVFQSTSYKPEAPEQRQPRAHETSMEVILKRVSLVRDHHGRHAALSEIERSVASGGLGRRVAGGGHRARAPFTAAVILGGFGRPSTPGRPWSVERVVGERLKG